MLLTKNTSAGAPNYSLTLNGDTGANYSYSRLYQQGSTATITVSKNGTSSSHFLEATSAVNDYFLCEITIMGKSGLARGILSHAITLDVSGTNIEESFLNSLWENTANQVTSITLTSSVAAGFGIGTYIRVETIGR